MENVQNNLDEQVDKMVAAFDKFYDQLMEIKVSQAELYERVESRIKKEKVAEIQSKLGG